VFVAVVIAAALAFLAQPSGAAVRTSRTVSPHARVTKALGQLLTYGYNNARDGVDTADPSFAHLKAAWTVNINGGIYGQPLIDGKLVIVATELDEVYALNASTGKVAWKFSIGRAQHLDHRPGARALVVRRHQSSWHHRDAGHRRRHERHLRRRRGPERR